MDPQLQQNLLTHLQQITRDRDPFLATAGHFYVRQYIYQQFEQWGEVKTHGFQFRGKGYENLILDLPAADRSPQHAPILIGAHYDTVPGSPGADDNATGVAVLLELARALTMQPARRPVRCIAFDLEELGLVGSRHYVMDHPDDPLRLMISLEMLGYCDRTPGSQRYPPGIERFYPKQGDFIALIGNWPALPDLIRLSRTIRKAGEVPCEWLPAGQRGQILPATRRSDHSPFWDHGYRAIMVTDTADFRNPHYHQSSDRLETIDLPFLTKVCQGLIEGIRLL